jgi:3-oxoacyl-[acyl-carrier protein] reductase
MDTGLKNRIAIVAASSQGIGRAAAEALAAEGCSVAMCARNRDTLNAAADSIRSRHQTEVLAEPLDVTDSGAVRDFVTAVVKKFGSVDICVTNAGGPPAKAFLATTIDEWKRAVD